MTAKHGGLPDPDSTSPDNTVVFLKGPMIGRVGTRASITFLGEGGRMIASDFGQQIVFPVTFKGKRYDLPVKLGSGNHTRLFDRFGRKAPKGSVDVEVKEFNDNPYVAILKPNEGRKPGPKSGRRKARK